MLRYERKYLVPYRLLDSLRKRMLPFVRPDIYANINEYKLPQYTVRSIYLDTAHMDCHEEKTEGVELRKKFRIRSYNDYNPDGDTVLEIKKKIENRIKKHRAFTSFKHVIPLMETADIQRYIRQDESGSDMEDAHRFFFHVKKRNLKPKVLIVYEREAYHGLMDDGVRITFDKNIRSSLQPEWKDMFNQKGLKHLFPSHFILEIKYFTDRMPVWAKSMIQEFHLRNDALSKYTIGYDVNTRHNFFTY